MNKQIAVIFALVLGSIPAYLIGLSFIEKMGIEFIQFLSCFIGSEIALLIGLIMIFNEDVKGDKTE